VAIQGLRQKLTESLITGSSPAPQHADVRLEPVAAAQQSFRNRVCEMDVAKSVNDEHGIRRRIDARIHSRNERLGALVISMQADASRNDRQKSSKRLLISVIERLLPHGAMNNHVGRRIGLAHDSRAQAKSASFGNQKFPIEPAAVDISLVIIVIAGDDRVDRQSVGELLARVEGSPAL
jgi:hypothetical protein